MSRAHWLLLLAALPGGCATPQLDPQIVSQVLASAADQVKRCYRLPRGRYSGRHISTRIRVRFGRDGALIGLPRVVEQFGVSPANRQYADEMAQAASLAVIRCAPLRLPPETYAGAWREFDLTFSLGVRA